MTYYRNPHGDTTDMPRRAVLILSILAALAAPLTAADPPAAGGAAPPPNLAPLVNLLGQIDDPAVHRDVLRGITEAVKGRRGLPVPNGWADVYAKLSKSPDAEVRERAQALALLFGDTAAIDALRKTLSDPTADAAARQKALSALVQVQDPDLAGRLADLLADKAMAGAALRALAAYADDSTPPVILSRYGKFTAAEKADAVATLAARPAWALALLEAVEKGSVPPADLSVVTVRQLSAFGDKAIDEKLKKVWGSVRPPDQDKKELIAKYKAVLTPEAMKDADPSRGRAVFVKACASCHRLFDAGGAVGPDLTGSQRANLDYVLEHVLDPNALVGRDYQVTVIQTTDGRVLNGLVTRDDASAVALQTANEVVVVPRNEIRKQRVQPVSMMPEGLLTALSDGEARDLVAYLASPAQVPPKDEAPNP
jgi:putative heme-binding domain-containing protein